MPLRLKKLLGSLGIMLFLLFWISLTVGLSGFVPRHWAAELAFYAFFGLAWGLPLLPVLKWMEKTK